MTISNAYPDILQNGTTADATQVMADFYQIQNDVNANAAHNGANSDITSLTGLTTALAVAYGGTGVTSYSALATAMGVLLATNNLSDVPNKSTALTNLGALAAANNLSDVASASTALSNLGGAPLANPAFTGGPTAPTPSTNNSSTLLATTAFVQNQFTSSYLSANGYQKLPGGLILQWGDSFIGTVTFPLSFVTACFVVVAIDAGTGNYAHGVSSITKTNFVLSSPQGGTSAYWLALGS